MQRLRRGGVHIISSSKARTMVTSSPSRLNAGSSSSWLQHSLPMLAAGGGGGDEFLVEWGWRGRTRLKASCLACGICLWQRLLTQVSLSSLWYGWYESSLLSCFLLWLWVLVVEASLSTFPCCICSLFGPFGWRWDEDDSINQSTPTRTTTTRLG